MVAVDWYYLMFVFFFAGGLSVFFGGRHSGKINYVAHGLAALGCLATILCAIFVFRQGALEFPLPLSLPFGVMTARVDLLAAFFLLLIGVGGLAASVYAMGYSKEYYGNRYGLMTGLFNVFLLSMVMVITVSHVAAFVIAWEVMSIVSFLLVNFEYEKPANTRAAFVYIVMTHVGTIFIISAFLLLTVAAGSMDFIRFDGSALSATTRNIVFLCAFVGFGTKAGMIPLHIWLPQAHPVAPSHISALMSGVMIKTAIYGMCRFFLDFLGAGPVWWGGLILAIAILSCVLGVLYALMENDLKRLLAYSSVENIGIMLLGIGSGMIFMSKGEPLMAGLSWSAVLYHAFNHAVFKSLLFMGAGAVLQSTHTKDIERLGGLIKKMPYTAVFFLVGAATIAALPPLNGFISEWLTFQALFLLPQAVSGVAAKLAGMVLIALLGLTGALAAACFVKAFGIAFLAKPRSLRAENAQEVSYIMLAPMAGLAVLCVLLGVWPQGMITLISSVLADFSGLHAGELLSANWYSIAFTGANAGGLSIPLTIGILLIGVLIAVGLSHLYGSPRTIKGETWTCGIVPTSHMQYTATGFSGPIRRVFHSVLRPQRETIVDEIDTNHYFGRRLSYQVAITYVFNDMVYRPINRTILLTARFMKTIQAGSLQLYIGYIMAVTVLVLIWNAGW
ncbi:MAG: dehydrogenase (quinone) [Firmicutes bacterium]|nr:dehydrogenase (quinone) [Bacillota bacterium]